MDKRMEEVRPGETLAADILDRAGRLLFPKGVRLTESAIAALRQRGVERVSVAGARKPFNAVLMEKATLRARKFYAGHDLARPPGPVLLGLRIEAEAQRLEGGLPPLLRECRGPAGDAPGPENLPVFSLDAFQPPDLPSVAHELNRVLFSSEPSSQRVVELIGRSPGLTARLLRLVNTPLYGFQGRVETVSRAVTIVGLREVGMLAASLLMVDQFGVIQPSVVDMRTFVEHCVGCALIAKTLAEATGLVEPEQAFVAGLLHDIGRLYFFTAFPERSRFCIDSARKHDRPLLAEEARFFGMDHGAMGQRLLDGWGMPPALGLAAGHHHDPLQAAEPLFPGVMHMADVLVHAMGLGCSGECWPPEACPGLTDLVPLSPDGLADIAARIGEQIDTIMAAF